jgi:phage FluMu protein Com
MDKQVVAYKMRCTKCPKMVAFLVTPGRLMVTCRTCRSVIWYSEAESPLDIPMLPPDAVVVPPEEVPVKYGGLKPDDPVMPRDNADDKVAERDVVWRDGEREQARRLLDW